MSYQIFYLYGFNSSKGSSTAKKLQSIGINFFELDYQSYGTYRENFDSLCFEVEKRVMKDKAFMFIGNSLGGFYAGMLAWHFCSPVILINPVIKPLEDLQGVLKKTLEYDLYDFSFEVIASYPEKLEISKSKYLLIQSLQDEVLDSKKRRDFFSSHLNVDFIFMEGGHLIEDFYPAREKILDFMSCVLDDKN